MNISTMVSVFAAAAMLPTLGSAAGPVGQWDGCGDGTAGSGLVNGIANASTMVGSTVYVGGKSTLVTTGVPLPSFLEKYLGTNRWTGTGTTNPYGSGEITAMSSDAQNLYVAGGSFGLYVPSTPLVSKLTVRAIAKWTGSAWVSIGTLVPVSSSQTLTINAITPGATYVGGAFSNLNGVTGASGVASFAGGTVKALGTGIPGTVYAIAVAANGDVYVGGQFKVTATSPTGGTATANNIARWSSGKWMTVGSSGINLGVGYPNYGVGGTVYAIAINKATNDVYLGGTFGSAMTVSVNNIVKINGTTSTTLGSGVNGKINSLLLSGSSVYAGGSFTTAGGLSANNIAKWNGTAWSALDTGVNGEVKSIIGSSGNIYVAGGFTKAGATTTTGCARWYGAAD